MKKFFRTGAAMLALMMALGGCGGETAVVPVVKVSMLTQAGAAADHYAGVVVSESAVEVQRDTDQTIDEIYVSVGDSVRAGDKLFSYDSDELNLELDRKELELDRLEAEVTAKKKQISDVETELKTATGDTKTQLNIQLRQLQTELTEAEYDEEDLTEEISYIKQMLRNVDVTSPIDGTVRKIDESAAVCVTIQQAGAFQVQGTLNELNLDAGLSLGSAVEIVSRLDENRVWTGNVTMIDYSDTTSNSYDSLYGYSDSLSSSTSYPFYVTLDSTEGLLLGQHVYIRLAGINSGSTDRVLMPESYLMDVEYDDKTMILSASVWCPDEEGRLVRQKVVLGEYVSGCYVILEGLTLEGYVADPSNPDCREGAMSDLRAEEDFGQVSSPADGAQTVPTGTAEQTGGDENPEQTQPSGNDGSGGESQSVGQEQNSQNQSGGQEQNSQNQSGGQGQTGELGQEEDMGSWS